MVRAVSLPEQQRLAELWKPASGGAGCWEGGGRGARRPVAEGSEEWAAVAGLFLQTVNGERIPTRHSVGAFAVQSGSARRTVVLGIDRLQIPHAYAAYHRRNFACGPGKRTAQDGWAYTKEEFVAHYGGTDEWDAADGMTMTQVFMFHGCRGLTAENGIISKGFIVPKHPGHVKHYGRNNGIWLAYLAAYSDNAGFCSVDATGESHIFVAAATAADARLDDGVVMRVVGEDCAYPAYLLRYKHDG